MAMPEDLRRTAAALHGEAELLLDLAIQGLDLTAKERLTLAWIKKWEPETIENVASVISKARRVS